MDENRQVMIASIPRGALRATDFELRTGPIPEVADDKATVQGMQYRNHLLIKDRAFEEALMLEALGYLVASPPRELPELGWVGGPDPKDQRRALASMLEAR